MTEQYRVWLQATNRYRDSWSWERLDGKGAGGGYATREDAEERAKISIAERPFDAARAAEIKRIA